MTIRIVAFISGESIACVRLTGLILMIPLMSSKAA